MSLLRRGQTWWAYFYVDGIRHQYSTGSRNRRQAEKIEQKLREEVIAQRHQLVEVDPDMKFGELGARFIATVRPRTYTVERFGALLPYFSDIRVLRITKSMTEDYRRRRKTRDGVTDATVNRDLSVLRRVLYWAVDERLLVANPIARLRLVRERRPPRRVLSLDEEQRLLVECAPHLRSIAVMALDTGMRRGEILNQLWEHVDFFRRTLYVSKSKTAGGESREIPLTQRVYEILAAMRQPEGVVFRYEGKPLKAFARAWRQALRRAEVRYLRFHDLRHTFNTRLMEAGVLQEVRMALMGHVNPQRVHSTYTHVESPVKREAIARLEKWVQQQQQQPLGGQDGHTETL